MVIARETSLKRVVWNDKLDRRAGEIKLSATWQTRAAISWPRRVRGKQATAFTSSARKKPPPPLWKTAPTVPRHLLTPSSVSHRTCHLFLPMRELCRIPKSTSPTVYLIVSLSFKWISISHWRGQLIDWNSFFYFGKFFFGDLVQKMKVFSDFYTVLKLNWYSRIWYNWIRVNWLQFAIFI